MLVASILNLLNEILSRITKYSLRDENAVPEYEISFNKPVPQITNILMGQQVLPRDSLE